MCENVLVWEAEETEVEAVDCEFAEVEWGCGLRLVDPNLEER